MNLEIKKERKRATRVEDLFVGQLFRDTTNCVNLVIRDMTSGSKVLVYWDSGTPYLASYDRRIETKVGQLLTAADLKLED